MRNFHSPDRPFGVLSAPRRHLWKAFGMAALVGGGYALGAVSHATPAMATPEQTSPSYLLGEIGRVLFSIENDYVDPVERSRLLTGAIKGMVAELDPHSSYMPKEEYANFLSDAEGRFGGVGIEVDGRGDVLVVIAPIEGGPAARAGVKSGDKILLVDGKDVRGASLDAVVKKMRGTPGTQVKVTVKREGESAPLTFNLVREIIHIDSVVVRSLANNIGYVRIKQFQEGTHAELIRALAKLRKETSLRGVLLDVRANPGGLVNEAAAVADEFLEAGGIYSMRHRGSIVEEARAHRGGTLTAPKVVVLVNEWSASSSELLVGALQDNKRASVVGSNTFGKGSVQSIMEIGAGTGLKLTTARYFTPSGHAIQGDGIHPDVEVARAASDDLPIVRERDLEGALSAETRGGAAVAPPAPTKEVSVDAGAAKAEEKVVAGNDVPKDPSTSTDSVLRTGYGLLLRQIGK